MLKQAGTCGIIVALAIACACGAARPAHAQATIGGSWRADVARFAERVVAAGLTPGAGLAVATGDRVAYAAGFGTADMASGRRVTGETPFYIASTTKSLTALAAVLAGERGDLDLRAPMVRYLPAARLPDGVEREAITVRDLIALTHGLSGSGPVVIRTAFTGEFTRDQLLELLRFHAPTGRRGTFSYNNLGYNLVGLVLEAVYGRSWKDVVRRDVLEPLGMTATTAYLSRAGRDRIARPHALTPETFAPMRLGKEDANLHAAGGHFASARDLARYLAAHISGGLIDGRRVLPAPAVYLTHRQQVPQDRDFGPFHRFGWGYGWDLGTYEGDTLIHRFGGFAGYRSHASFMPAHGLGVVVLVNAGGPASSAADLIATYVYDRLLSKPDLEQRYTARLDSLVAGAARSRRELAEHHAERRTRLAPLPHPLEAYAGVFENEKLGRMVWRVVAAGLELHMGVVTSRAEVFDAATNRLRIEVGGSGQVAEFIFPSDGGLARAVRLADEEFTRVASSRAPPP